MKINFTVAFFLLFTTLAKISAQAPPGYYNPADGKSCNQLKTALKTIISSGTPMPYSSLWGQYEQTDIKPREVGSGSAMVIYDIYSDKPGPGNDPYNFTPGTGNGGQQDQGSGGGSEGEYYNREHSIPLSWFNGSTGSPGPATDYNHIFPTDKYVNGKRSNWPYGKVAFASQTMLNGSKLGSSAIAGINGTVFEPIDSFKGDVARAFLYFVTRYEDNMPGYATNNESAQAFEPNTYPSVDLPFLQLMISWHLLDPVSTKETVRNNGAYTYQGNRNPYVDHPEYVQMVWNSTCPGLGVLPVDIVYFGGELKGEFMELQWKIANEINLAGYEVQKSYNGMAYFSIGDVEAVNAGVYTLRTPVENDRGRQVFYRIKKKDKNGSFTFSQVYSLHIPLSIRFAVYPNPASSFIKIKPARSVNGPVSIRLADAAGRIVVTRNLNVTAGDITINTNNLSNGFYEVVIVYNGERFVKTIRVNR